MGNRSIKWILVIFMAIAPATYVALNWRSEATADVVVYKSPTCGCCDLWVAPVRAKYRVPERLASCHTARAGNYTIEGHVPASDIRRLLSERPAVASLAVPGMPIGSPGMQQEDRHDPYAVLAFDSAGRTSVFEQH